MERSSEVLEPESQIASGLPVASEGPPSPVLPALPSNLDDQILQAVTDPKIQGLIHRMLNGDEPYGRPLSYWEQKKFNPTNISVVLLRAAGFKGKEIAAMIGQDQATISITIRHPYGQKLLSLLMPIVAAQSLDVRRRTDHYASILLDRVFEMGLESEDANEVARISFGLMDRSSFAVTKKTQVEHTITAGSAQIDRLARAMEESNALEVSVDYELLPSPEGSVGRGTSAPVSSDGDTRSLDVPPIEGSSQEKVA